MTNLFLDISSSCTGYVVSRDGKILDIGVVWFPKDTDIVKKCNYIRLWASKITFEYKVDSVIYERYSFNMKNPNGGLACPQIQGAIFSACFNQHVVDITPQTWRKQCGLKKKKTENWKEVTKAHFRSLYDLPEKIESNITGNMRTTPSDYYDALGICIGWHNLNGLEVGF